MISISSAPYKVRESVDISMQQVRLKPSEKAIGLICYAVPRRKVTHTKTVVQMLKDNGIQKVKLFDTDHSTMTALVGSGIEVMVAIPDDQLSALNSFKCAQDWVKRNVTRYNFSGSVNIK
ncbi:Glucan endo-1,3-beta-glucosidase 8 [Morus notabilis]|uniref:glucan endo-1,3-beta-D-glucosidase n=1 Tax=Morus notabilis TaxID=981085 RepID=W9S9M9_9ROSA|nr:Glucan endo-1,3-beta-glucosidase 8 [Morus notabilis]